MSREGEWLKGTIPEEMNGVPYGELLREYWGMPRKMVHLLFQNKELIINDVAATLHMKANAGDKLRMKTCPIEDVGLPISRLPLDVLYEDDHLLIVNKPSGQLLHPTDAKHQGTLDHAVAYYFHHNGIQSKVRHVHRLDQESSGAVLYAKHPLASSLLDEQLRRKEIYREYIAIVHGRVNQEKGVIDKPIGKDPHHSSRRIVSLKGDEAITHYEVMERYHNATQVRCRLETGRTHQIRVHFQYIGHALIGDKLYGGRALGISRQALHAYRLRGLHPLGENEFEAIAPLPEDMISLLQKIKVD